MIAETASPTPYGSIHSNHQVAPMITPSNTWFHGLTRVCGPQRHLGSVFAGLAMRDR